MHDEVPGGTRPVTRRTLIAAGATGAAALVAGTRPGDAAAWPGRRPARRWKASARGRASWLMPAHDLAATRSGGPLAGVDVRWRVELPGGIPATAAIAAGRVYAASAGGTVGAFSLADGRERWRRELGTAGYGSGADARELGFFGGVAVAGSHVLAASDRVHCLDAHSGRTRWTSAPLRTPDSDDYFWGLPTVVGPLVLVGSGSGAELPTARGRLTAYRLRDGALAWTTATVPAGANGGGIIGPASVDPRAGIVYVATGSPYEAVPGPNPGTCAVIALRLRDGAVLWEDQVHAGDTRGLDFNSAPVIAGRLLLATNKDGVYAWDRVRRRRRWHQQVTDPFGAGDATAGPTTGPEGGPIATDGRRAYVLSNDGTTGGCVAAALAVQDGRELWRTPLPAPSFAAPALAGRVLCVAAADGTLRVIDADRGRILAEAALGDPSAAAPAVARGRLVVGVGAQPYLPGSSLVCLG